MCPLHHATLGKGTTRHWVRSQYRTYHVTGTRFGGAAVQGRPLLVSELRGYGPSLYFTVRSIGGVLCRLTVSGVAPIVTLTKPSRSS